MGVARAPVVGSASAPEWIWRVSKPRAFAMGRTLLIVLHHRERVVEVVEECPPALVVLGAPEAFGVVLQRLPLGEEEEAVRVLDAAAQLVAEVAAGPGAE